MIVISFFCTFDSIDNRVLVVAKFALYLLLNLYLHFCSYDAISDETKDNICKAYLHYVKHFDVYSFTSFCPPDTFNEFIELQINSRTSSKFFTDPVDSVPVFVKFKPEELAS
jgi:hypothetical protein